MGLTYLCVVSFFFQDHIFLSAKPCSVITYIKLTCPFEGEGTVYAMKLFAITKDFLSKTELILILFSFDI